MLNSCVEFYHLSNVSREKKIGFLFISLYIDMFQQTCEVSYGVSWLSLSFLSNTEHFKNEWEINIWLCQDILLKMIPLSCISQNFPPAPFPLPPSNPSWDGRLSSPSLLYLTYLIIYCFILFLYNSLDRKHGPLGRVEKPERAFWFPALHFFLSLYDSALMEVFHSGELYKVVRENQGRNNANKL